MISLASRIIFSFHIFVDYSLLKLGSSIAWVGTYNNSLARGASTGTYAIDGGAPIAFTINNVASISTPILFNQVLFQASQDTLGAHHLEVEFQGAQDDRGLGSTSSTGSPLSLSYILVRNAKNVDSSASVTSTTSTTSTTSWSSGPTGIITSGSPQGGHHSSPVIGAIIGSVAAVVVIALLGLGTLLWRRRRSKPLTEKDQPPRESDIHPFISPPLERTLSAGHVPSKGTVITLHDMPSLLRNSVVRPSKAQISRTSGPQLDATTTTSTSLSDDGSSRPPPAPQAANGNTVVIEVPPNYTVT